MDPRPPTAPSGLPRPDPERFEASLGEWLWDPATDLVRMTGGLARYLGTPVDAQDDVSAYRTEELIHPDDLETMRECARRMLCGESDTFSADYRMRTRDSEWRWFVAQGRVTARDAQGHAKGVRGVCLDVTERRREEQEARERETRFRDIVDSFVDWYWELDAQFRFSRIEGRATGLPDDARHAVMGRVLWESGVEPVDAAWSDLRGVFERREQFRDMLLERRRPDGTSTFRSVSGRPLYDAQGRFLGYHGVAQDVTALVLSRRALTRSEARFRDFARASSDWMSETDQEGRYTWISESARELRDVDPSWFIGKRRTDFAPEGTDFRAEPWKSHLEALARREPFRNFRYLARDPAGDGIVSVSGVPYFDADGRFRGYRNVISNVADEIALEKRAHDAEELLRAAVEHMDQEVVLCDRDDRIVFCNARFRRTNRALEDLLQAGTPYPTFLREGVRRGLFPDAAGRESEWLANRIARRATAPGQMEQRRNRGRWFLVSDFRLPDGSLITFALDITERRNLQEQKDREAQAQRSALVREVHHRIKNNLQGIATLLDLRASEQPAVAAPLRDAIQQIQAIARVHGLYGRGASNLSLGSLVEDIVAAAGGGWREIALQRAEAGGDWMLAEEDAVAMALVVNELVWNAVKHSDPGSTRPIEVSLQALPNGRARLEVRSPGAMPERPRGGSVGLGLVRMLLPPPSAAIEVSSSCGTVVASVELRLAFARRVEPAAPAAPSDAGTMA